MLFTARADSHRSAPQGRCLRSLLRGAAGAARRGAGGGCGHGRQVTRDPPARAAPRSPPGPARATIEPPVRPFPSSPQHWAPGTRDHRPQGAGRPCPPRAASPGHGQPLSTRAAASHLSPREAAGAAPGCPSPCGPGGPPVTPAPSLARAPSCRGYSIATAAASAARRGRPELGSLPTRRGGAGRGRGRRAGSDALRRLPPAAQPRPWRGI